MIGCTAQDAELVAFGVGEDGPAQAVGGATVDDEGGAEAQQPLDLLLARCQALRNLNPTLL